MHIPLNTKSGHAVFLTESGNKEVMC